MAREAEVLRRHRTERCGSAFSHSMGVVAARAAKGLTVPERILSSLQGMAVAGAHARQDVFIGDVIVAGTTVFFNELGQDIGACRCVSSVAGEAVSLHRINMRGLFWQRILAVAGAAEGRYGGNKQL